MQPRKKELASDPWEAIEKWEEARQADPELSFQHYLPSTSHPLYAQSLAEMIRRDLTWRWRSKRPKPLYTYRDEFPAVFADKTLLTRLALVEYLLRQLNGGNVSVREYELAFGISTTDWPQPPATTMHFRIDPQHSLAPAGKKAQIVDSSWDDWLSSPFFADEEADSKTNLRTQRSSNSGVLPVQPWPEAGAECAGFRLLRLLGQGAFARVFLAEQGDLAHRPVVLKITRERLPEPQLLAQLQHTNIVPIYSHHYVGDLSVVCMPFFGSTTLADLVEHIQARGNLPQSGHDIADTVLRRRTHQPGQEAPPSVQDFAPISDRTPVQLSPAWKTLERYTYADAVLWIMARVAAGLTHAHERGILHRDIKPANILLSEDGEPMLLDFSIAEDTKTDLLEGSRLLGGTLPYLAPEHLLAFQEKRLLLDERGDIYALGVILFELLSGQMPYPLHHGLRDLALMNMIEDRKKPPSALPSLNRLISPGIAAIVHKCLAVDPQKRYQSARQVHEDLEHQLQARPLRYAKEPLGTERLRKWAKRHPRLSSSVTVATVAMVMLLGLAIALIAERGRRAELQAHTRYQEHLVQFQNVQAFLDDQHAYSQLDDGHALCVQGLEHYGLTTETVNDNWERKQGLRFLTDSERGRLHGNVAELYFLLAKINIAKIENLGVTGSHRQLLLEEAQRWNELAQRYGGARLPKAALEQQADLLALAGQDAPSQRIRAEARQVPLTTARDYYLLGYAHMQHGRYRDALPLLHQSILLDPENFSAWFVSGNAYIAVEQPELALPCFNSCVTLRKDFAPAWLNHGLCCRQLRLNQQALDDFDRAVQLQPDLAEAWLQRAATNQALGKWPESVHDLTRALECGSHPTRVYFLRSKARQKTGDLAGANSDRAEGLRLKPNDELSWIARAEMRLPAQANEALADVEAALQINPHSRFGLQMQAHILGEHLHRDADALKALNRAIELYPDHVPVRAGRGVLLARQGERQRALDDAREALLRDNKPPNLYQVACIYALTSKQNAEGRLQALQLLRSALRGGFGLDLIDTDNDLDPLREQAEFRQLQDIAKAWRSKIKG
jgi:serine/threonine protein kinase/Tfp pilus assembly protein PilF